MCPETEVDSFISSGKCQKLFITIVLYNENTGAEAWSNRVKSMRRSKHVDVMYHFIRECIVAGHTATEHVESHENLAECLTKPLPRECCPSTNFVRFAQMPGGVLNMCFLTLNRLVMAVVNMSM